MSTGTSSQTVLSGRVDGKTGRPLRRFDLDWLRVLATLAVFTMHCTRFFDAMPWEVKNNVQSEGLTLVTILLAQWLMPLFFIVSGAAIYFALHFRSPVQFIKERVTRILIPFLLVGVFVLVYPQEYIRAVSHGDISEHAVSVFQGYPLYLSHISLFRDQFPWIALPTMHLWYLLYLFIFSLLTLPLFLYLRTESGRGLISRLAAFFDKPVTIFLLPLPIVVLNSFLDPSTNLGNRTSWGGWNLLTYLILLVLGYVVFADERFQRGIRRLGGTALALAVLTAPVYVFAFMQFFSGEGFLYGTPEYVALVAVRVFNSWCIIVGFLAMAQKYLNRSNGVLKYASEASLPFYMLHQTIIVIIGFCIAAWAIGILPKFLFLAATSFVVIMAIYEFLIRRINVLRFLFGMKPRRKEPQMPILQPERAKSA